MHSREGSLSFPNGSLSLRRATAHVSREPGQATPQVWLTDTEADGRIGDYYVSLSPTGLIFPLRPPGQEREAQESGAAEWARRVRQAAAERARGGAKEKVEAGGEISASPLQWNAVSIPSLDEAYIMALLAGPVLAPAVGETSDIAAMLANPRAPAVTGGEVSGFVLPYSGTGLGELSFEAGLHGPMRLRVGERLFRRFQVSYISPLSGPPEARAVRINYEITPRWTIGSSNDALDWGRVEIQTIAPF